MRGSCPLTGRIKGGARLCPMPSPRRALAVLLAAALAIGACETGPVMTEAPTSSASPSAVATPVSTEVPFSPEAWPVAGSACEDPAYEGRVGRIEALDALTIRFTLCAPDGAFRTRLAHPSLAILDATTIVRLAADGSAGRTIAGTGAYRIEAWTADTVRLGLADADQAGAADPAHGSLGTVIIGWSADADARTAAVLAASVDGIDGPDTGDAEAMAAQPEVAVLVRPGLATSYLGFGSGPAFGSVRVRRAISMALDRDALAAAVGPGSVPATYTAPCAVAGGCEGTAWYAFNGPSAAAALAATRFNLGTIYPLRVPDAPVPGLPDPLATAEAVRDQLRASIGMLLELEIVPAATLAADLAAGKVSGLYLGGIASPLADASGFLEPLFGHGATSTAAGRATGMADILDELSRTTGIAARAAVLATANDVVRSTAPIAPLVHPGSMAVFRSDVAGAAASPLGLDELGSFTPGDRRQLVFIGAAEPDGAWCADQDSLDAFRLCGLVTEGLYGFRTGTLAIEPRLAVRCAPDADATTWTCRLRPDTTFHDGMRLDAGDVLASFVAQWDGGSPLRTAGPPGAFASWDALFGAPTGG